MQHRTLASRAQARINWRSVLEWLTFVTALQIAFHSFFVNQPVIPMAVAGVWLAGCYWIYKGGRGGPILIAVLASWELVGSLLFVEEFGEGFPTWLIVPHLMTVVPALAAAVMTLWSGDDRRTNTRSSRTTVELGG